MFYIHINSSQFLSFQSNVRQEIWDNEWFYGLNGLVLGVQLS